MSFISPYDFVDFAQGELVLSQHNVKKQKNCHKEEKLAQPAPRSIEIKWPALGCCLIFDLLPCPSLQPLSPRPFAWLELYIELYILCPDPIAQHSCPWNSYGFFILVIVMFHIVLGQLCCFLFGAITNNPAMNVHIVSFGKFIYFCRSGILRLYDVSMLSFGRNSWSFPEYIHLTCISLEGPYCCSWLLWALGILLGW